MQAAANQQLTSIYTKVGDASLADTIKSVTNDSLKLDELKKSFPQYYESYKTYAMQDDLNNVNEAAQAPEVIANAAMLFRFQVEVLEILSENTSLSEVNKKEEIIKNLFGDGSEYKKLYDEYYGEDGLVKRAQANFKNIPIIPLFQGIIPQSFDAKNQVKLDDLQKTFKEIKNVKQTMGVDATHSHSINLMTTHLDKGNTESTMLGLVMSDPRQLGAIFAMIGNKEKNGEIDIIQDKSSHFGKNSWKGAGKSALRCLFVVAILGAFIAGGTFAAPAIAGLIGITSAAAGITAAVGAIVSGVIGVTAIAYADKKVGEEIRYTYHYQPASVNSDFGKVGVSSDNVTRFTLAPYYKGRLEDKKAAMKSEFEKRANNISTNIFKNRQVINASYGAQDRDNLDKITKNLENALNKFGIKYEKKGVGRMK